MRAFGVLTAIVIFASPVFAQSFGGGVTATTPTSGIDSMATAPGANPPGTPINGANGITNPAQPDFPPGSYPSDVVSKEPGVPPPVSGGISRQSDRSGKKKNPTDTNSSKPQQ